jgi:hypothetical protein
MLEGDAFMPRNVLNAAALPGISQRARSGMQAAMDVVAVIPTGK